MIDDIKYWIREHSIGLVFIGIFIVMSTAVVFISSEGEKTMQAGYAAWVKQTGNEKKLSYAEWRALVETTRPKDDTTIIFMPTGR